MLNNSQNLFHIYCKVIDNFSPCMNDYLYIFDLINDEYFISKEACQRFLLPGNHFKNATKEHLEFVYSDDYPLLKNDIELLSSGEKKDHNLKYRWIGINGDPIWINCRGRVITHKDGNIQYMIGCINEIGKKQIADNLSGLMGEVSFINDISQKPSLSRGFILRIGIDDFKKINERIGIVYGDKVLQKMAHFIQANISASQNVYRIVADEFIISDFSSSNLEDAILLYQKIKTMIEKFLDASQYKIFFTISAGILTLSDYKYSSYEDLLKLSQFSLSQAKINGKNQSYHFRIDDYNAFLRKRELEIILRNAVSHDFKGFHLHYQPIIEPKSHHLFAAEALLRFTTEDGLMISPMEMIPCLEETGLIIPVGKWVMRTAFEMCKKISNIHPDFHIAINLSYIQLKKSPVFEDIKDTLQSIGLSGSNVIVELTESGSLDHDPIILNVWNSFRSIGIHIAVDDFGTGYSNFSHISELHPDFVKIDRQFTIRAFQNDYDFLLLENVIQLARNLHLRFIVEGIEKKHELDKIMLFQPEFIQGFYYGRPCDEDNFKKQFL